MADFAVTVRRYMTERGMSLRGLAQTAHYDPGQLSKVLNGHRTVTPYLAACLDEALGAGGEITAAAQMAASEAEAARLPLRELADHAAELGQWAETGNAGPGTIATLEDEITRVTREYGSSQPGPLILRAADACRRTSALLRQHQRLRHARDLYVVAARCCAFLAVALGDLGRQPEAAAYARTALTLAEESADPGAVAVALSALSKIAFWDGLRQEAAGNGGSGGGLFDCGTVRLSGYAATLALREGSLAGVLAAAAAAENAVRDGETRRTGRCRRCGSPPRSPSSHPGTLTRPPDGSPRCSGCRRR